MLSPTCTGSWTSAFSESFSLCPAGKRALRPNRRRRCDDVVCTVASVRAESCAGVASCMQHEREWTAHEGAPSIVADALGGFGLDARLACLNSELPAILPRSECFFRWSPTHAVQLCRRYDDGTRFCTLVLYLSDVSLGSQAEIVKLFMSMTLLVLESRRTGAAVLGELREFKFNCLFLIPAAIYTCTNNLSFLIYERLDPGSERFKHARLAWLLSSKLWCSPIAQNAAGVVLCCIAGGLDWAVLAGREHRLESEDSHHGARTALLLGAAPALDAVAGDRRPHVRRGHITGGQARGGVGPFGRPGVAAGCRLKLHTSEPQARRLAVLHGIDSIGDGSQCDVRISVQATAQGSGFTAGQHVLSELLAVLFRCGLQPDGPLRPKPGLSARRHARPLVRRVQRLRCWSAPAQSSMRRRFRRGSAPFCVTLRSKELSFAV